ncbi:phage tail assembly protein T [Escherichia coli]|uniref:phage tail assembly protein T n=1 Tax=Escherichia coli TaxID=562 RepID=UPI000B3EF018
MRPGVGAGEGMMGVEFDRVSPLGDERGDIRNAQIVKAVFGAQGMNVALKDAMLCWGEDEDKPEVDPFAALEDALSLAAMS